MLATALPSEPDWRVDSAHDAAAVIAHTAAGPSPRPATSRWGAVVEDPFGNRLVLVDLAKGRYPSGDTGAVGS
jgi:hypothetical protein